MRNQPFNRYRCAGSSANLTRATRPSFISSRIPDVAASGEKPIIIGKGASNLTYVKKKLRTPVNRIVGQKAKLDLHVKVAKGWQSDPKQLERLGF